MHSLLLRRSSKSTSVSKALAAAAAAAADEASAAELLPRTGFNAGDGCCALAQLPSPASSSILQQRHMQACARHALKHHLLIHSTVKYVEASSPQYTFSSNKMQTGAADANP